VGAARIGLPGLGSSGATVTISGVVDTSTIVALGAVDALIITAAAPDDVDLVASRECTIGCTRVAAGVGRHDRL
jgi:hypothetical protein